MLNAKEMYLDWLEKNIAQRTIDENVIELNLPFLDFENDYLEVYIIKKDGKYTVCTDFCKDELKNFSFTCENENELPCHIQNIVNHVLGQVIS